MDLVAAPGISSRVDLAHPNRFLAPILNLVSHALENFQGGLSPLQPTLGAATIYHVCENIWRVLGTAIRARFRPDIEKEHRFGPGCKNLYPYGTLDRKNQKI
jgi:hypothetical protein